MDQLAIVKRPACGNQLIDLLGQGHSQTSYLAKDSRDFAADPLLTGRSVRLNRR
jgi:hypothetical protein